MLFNIFINFIGYHFYKIKRKQKGNTMKMLNSLPLACALASGMAIPQFALADDAFEFHGYARYGIQYEEDTNTRIQAVGETGDGAGRLGNEGDGGEFKFVKNFEGDNGTQFDLGIMIEHWDAENGDMGLKQFYAGGTNLFASQPNAYFWAGRAFHNRIQQGINDYYFSWADGQGIGVKGLELSPSVTTELGIVEQSSLSSSTNFAFTSITNFKISDSVNMDVVADYGFTNNDSDDENATLIGTRINIGDHKVYLRYSDNTENDVLNSWNRREGQSSLLATVEGSFKLSENTGLEYNTTVQDIDSDIETDERLAYNIILRPTHQWNAIHSTWVEVGYSVVDFKDEQENNDAWKVTLSQNIAVGGFAWSRPMLRFYVTAGEETNYGVTENPVILGGMFEAWW